MKAKLYLKGDKEPVELSFAEGKSAQIFIADKSIEDSTTFSIEGVFTSKKLDMRFVKFEKDDAVQEKEQVVMTDIGFKDMQQEILQAELEAEFEGFKKYQAEDFWYQEKKVLRLEFKLNHAKERYYDRMIIDPVAYTRLQNLMEVYKQRIAKRDFVEKKEIEHLEKLAEQIAK